MTMQEVGEMLRSARLGKGLTLDDVHERTKISLYVLEALESGESERLPYPVYTKGFIHSYARLLGLDEAAILQDYLASVGTMKNLAIDTGVSEFTAHRNPGGRPGKVWMFLGILCLLGAGVWLAVFFIPQNEVPVQLEVQERSSAEDLPAPEVVSPVQNPMITSSEVKETLESVEMTSEEEVVSEEKNVAVSDVPVIDTPVEENVDEQPQNMGTEAAAPAGDGEDVVPAAVLAVPDAGAEKTGEHVLVVTARMDCWLRAVADGGVDGNKTVKLLHPGESISVSFAETLEIRLGNAGAVDFAVDGRPYVFEARSGEVKTLQITM